MGLVSLAVTLIALCIGVGTVVLLGTLAAAYVFQDRLLYLPVVMLDWWEWTPRQPKNNFDPSTRSPEWYGWTHEDLWMKSSTDETKLHAWFIHAVESPNRPPNENIPTVIFFHGNAGNIGFRLDFASCLVESCHCNIILVEYRGFGSSAGSPNEKDFIADAVDWLKFVQQHEAVDPSKIVVMGRSLGGAVAIGLVEALGKAAWDEGVDPPFQGLVLENTFLSIPRFCSDALQLLVPNKVIREWLVQTFVTLSWDSVSRIQCIPENLQVLFLSGLRDELVPPGHMASLSAKAASNQVLVRQFRHGMHNTTWMEKNYCESLNSWICSLS